MEVVQRMAALVVPAKELNNAGLVMGKVIETTEAPASIAEAGVLTTVATAWGHLIVWRKNASSAMEPGK